MRERGHTQCHCRRVICKCQSLACQGKSKRERGRRRVADGGEEKEGKNMSALVSWKSQERSGFGGVVVKIKAEMCRGSTQAQPSPSLTN